MQKDIFYYQNIIQDFKNSTVLVIGDIMLDKFIWGNVSRISPEAPVPVVKVERESSMPGGSANVINNLSSLGAKSYLVGVIGDDANGEVLIDYLNKENVNAQGIFKDKKRDTIVKTRIVANNQQVVRVDKEDNCEIDKKIISKMIGFISEKINEIDIIVIEDYGKGVVNSYLLQELIPLAKKYNKIIAVDPKEEHFHLYKGVSVITPNNKEASIASGIKIEDSKTLIQAGTKLLKELECDSVLITRGEQGMSLFEKTGKIYHIPTIVKEVYDVSGAGDTVIAAFALCLAGGADLSDCAYLSNIAGGIVVGKSGVAAVKPEEFKSKLEEKLCAQLV